MFSKLKYATIVSVTAIIGLSMPIYTVSAAAISNSKETVQISNSSASVVTQTEGQTITLQELMDVSNMSEQEKMVITNEFLSELKENLNSSMTRSRYYTIHQDLSNSQVKKVINSSNPGTTLAGFIPYAGPALTAIYYNYYSMYNTAAMNGWGIRITITTDSYNPTSTGTTFKVSYLK